MLFDEAIYALTAHLESAANGMLALHVDHGDYRADFEGLVGDRLSSTQGEWSTNLTDALVSLVKALEGQAMKAPVYHRNDVLFAVDARGGIVKIYDDSRLLAAMTAAKAEDLASSLRASAERSRERRA